MQILPTVLVMLTVLSTGSLTRADEFEALKTEFQTAQEKYWERPDGDKSDDPTAAYMARFRQLAEKHAGSPLELKSLAYILQKARRAPAPSSEPDAQWALKRLSEKHATNPAIGDVLSDLWFGFSPLGRQPMIDFYERIIRENKDKSVVARAKLSLATTLRNANERGMIESKPHKRPADDKRSTELFREIVAQHEGTESAKRAAHYLFEIEHLQVGMKAPDIVGKDADGKRIRLSDFKGKIVYLDFWGFW